MKSHGGIIVVGGGVIGLTTAYFLAKEGAHVVVCEQGRLGMESSWAGAGILPPSDSQHAQLPLGKFSKENIERRFRVTFKEKYAKAGLDAPVFTVQNADDIIIVVIGGAGKHSAYIPTFGATKAVTRALKRKDGQLAKSVEEFKQS